VLTAQPKVEAVLEPEKFGTLWYGGRLRWFASTSKAWALNSAVECHLHTSSRFNTFNNLTRLRGTAKYLKIHGSQRPLRVLNAGANCTISGAGASAGVSSSLRLFGASAVYSDWHYCPSFRLNCTPESTLRAVRGTSGYAGETRSHAHAEFKKWNGKIRGGCTSPSG
jgi:hypothetical protein